MNVDFQGALREIKPVVVQEYLRSRGWVLKRDASSRGYVEYVRGDVVTDVPIDPALSDYVRRLEELVGLLCEVHHMTAPLLLDELTQPVGDVLAVRMQSEAASSGTLPFEESLRLHQGTRNLLLAGAHSTLSAQPWFPRMSRAEAMTLLSKIHQGQTHRGSFTTRFIVPVEPAIKTLFPVEEEPYSRRVVRMLLRALEAVRQVRSLGGLEELTKLEADGVSGNLLAALASMAPTTGALEFSVSWSRNRPQPSGPAPKVLLPSESLNGLGAVAEAMRGQVASPSFELVGFITRLAREVNEIQGPGEVVVVPTEGEDRTITRVAVELDADSYAKAILAHSQDELVRITGTLTKQGRRWVLKEASQLERRGPATP